MELNPQQWNAVVDITNASLYHDLYDVHVEHPSIEFFLSIGEEGFSLEVIPMTRSVVHSEVDEAFTPEA